METSPIGFEPLTIQQELKKTDPRKIKRNKYFSEKPDYKKNMRNREFNNKVQVRDLKRLHCQMDY